MEETTDNDKERSKELTEIYKYVIIPFINFNIQLLIYCHFFEQLFIVNINLRNKRKHCKITGN